MLAILLSPGGMGKTWEEIGDELGISRTTMWRRMNTPAIKAAMAEHVATCRASVDNILVAGLPKAMRNLISIATDDDGSGRSIGVQHRDQVAAMTTLSQFLRLLQENTQFEAGRPRPSSGRSAALNVKVSRVGDDIHIVLGQAQLAGEDDVIDVTPLPS